MIDKRRLEDFVFGPERNLSWPANDVAIGGHGQRWERQQRLLQRAAFGCRQLLSHVRCPRERGGERIVAVGADHQDDKNVDAGERRRQYGQNRVEKLAGLSRPVLVAAVEKLLRLIDGKDQRTAFARSV